MKNRNKLLIAVSVIIMLLTLAFSANAALVGDVAGDSDGITSLDARTILRASVGLETLSAEAFRIADTNLDGDLTATDARTVLRMSVELEEILHYYTRELISEADCVTAGKGKATCTECDDTYEYDIPAFGHDYGPAKTISKLSCTTDGVIRYTCQREGCGHFKEKTTEKLGHIPDIPAATCTKDQVCTRANHVITKKLGHTTQWGVCTRCKLFITAKYKDQAKTIKDNFNEAKAQFDKAYEINSFNSMLDGISWKVLPNTKAAKKNYTAAKAAYEKAYAACGDIPEFAAIKTKLAKNIKNINGVLAQVEKILATPYFDDRNYEKLIMPLEELNYLNDDSIKSTNKAIAKLIVW